MDDLELARIHCDGMRELIADNPAHWNDEEALQLIRALCGRAREVMRDDASRAYLSAIDDHASALCWSAEGPAGSVRMFGPGTLRREILRELWRLSKRLDELGAQRSLAAFAPTQANVQRRERYASVVREAAESVGGPARLAALLEMPLQDVQRWVRGAETAPLKVFLASLDFVASGTLNADRRPVRVAALLEQKQESAPMLARIASLEPGREKAARRIPKTLRYAIMAIAVLFPGAVTLYLSKSARPAIALEAARSERIAPAPAMTELRTVALERTVPRKIATSKPKVKVAQRQPLAVATLVPAAEPPSVEACSSATGFSWIACQERARRERCAGREGMEADCPSVIPASPPQ